ncbi:hypothetical protein [Curtobacterium sp. MCSS17_016]|uniref:hypothetical protein n=1 Tax=Curtobacterium sp. MCSS17_016 TaxID=2175644 RepID=UPI0011B6C6DD|nr:hypothetical protein [Curtobacterium sp. MCSS17_016]WIE80545.1 hypothetical protein DEJ19_008255 [Curtobacterium sp. MCSS17_016]
MQINELSDADVDAVSAFHAHRPYPTRRRLACTQQLKEEVGELTRAHLARAGQARDKGLAGSHMSW